MRFYQALRGCDVIVVVNHLPEAFLPSLNIERLRAWFPQKPIVLYDLIYLPTSGNIWNIWLQDGKSDHLHPEIQRGGNYGLDRYDWYLCVSVSSDWPMPYEPQPYSLIGIDLDDGTLYPDQGESFTALLDFEMPAYMKERAVQIQALEETQTPYSVLHGRYDIPAIRSIYRKTSLYFLASHESFGLPICELQACGSPILLPYANWAPAHWLKNDLGQAGPGRLSPNFAVYDNDKDTLVAIIQRLKTEHKSQCIVQTFREYHPQLWRGDRQALRTFVDLVSRSRITSQSHRNYPRFRPLPTA